MSDHPTATPHTLLQVKGVTKQFGGLKALQDCSLDVPAKALFGLIGPNGSGKTTLFNVISGFFPPTQGQVLFKGQEITGLPAYGVTQRGLARTFQLVRVFPKMTLLENMLVGAQHQKSESIVPSLLQLPDTRHETAELVERAMGLLKVFALDHLADRLSGDVSYAEQKLLEIARTLMTKPELILLDEPASGILPAVVDRILDYVHQLRDEEGKAFIIIEHNMRVIMKHCDRIAVLNAGRKICEGPPEYVSCNPDVIRAYLGE